MSPIKERCLRHARSIRATAGLAAFGLTVLLVVSSVVKAEVDRVRASHAAQARVVAGMFGEATALLDELAREGGDPCSPAGLTALNQQLFFRRFVREIGVLGQGSLLCTTSLGRLAQPVRLKPPRYRLPGGIGLDVDVPVLVGGGDLTAIVLTLDDRFSVVLDPHVVRDIYARVDALWLALPHGLVPLHLPEAGQAQGGATPAPAWVARGRRLGLNARWGFDLFTPAGDSGVVLHASTRLAGIVDRHRLWLSGGLLLALFAGVLASAAARIRLALLTDIRQRIRYLCDEAHLVCLYQPIMDMHEGRIVGCEVLMRIRDGDTLIGPDVALPAVQHNHLQWKLDAAMARRALGELAAALPPMARFKIALNFFPENVCFERIHGLLGPLLKAARRDDFVICVEVTEHGFVPSVIEQSRLLKDAGYLLSVDDFGTGYSNLNIVKRMAPDILKIDKSFVFEMEDASVKSSLIPEIIGIARAVGAETIAEGIENESQARGLRELGVRYGQGYHFGRPMPLQAFIELLGVAPARQTGAGEASRVTEPRVAGGMIATG
ncbi:MAG: EAL domain-containing protein [Candidatus Dactylopiibacterium sp.]|nr:EAL domain-containing protein [Candidatus Dactylopiibacterium sp.]